MPSPFGMPSGSGGVSDHNYEEQSLLSSERIERSTNRIRDAKRVAIESEGSPIFNNDFNLYSSNWAFLKSF